MSRTASGTFCGVPRLILQEEAIPLIYCEFSPCVQDRLAQTLHAANMSLPFAASLPLPALAPLALATAALYLKSFLTTLVQARERLRTRKLAFLEDAAQWKGQVDPLCSELHHRASSALRNDCENIPYFLGLGLCYTLLDGPLTEAWLYFGGFVAARYLHTALFLAQRQPWRNRAFSASLLALVSLAVHTVSLAI